MYVWERLEKYLFLTFLIVVFSSICIFYFSINVAHTTFRRSLASIPIYSSRSCLNSYSFYTIKSKFEFIYKSIGVFVCLFVYFVYVCFKKTVVCVCVFDENVRALQKGDNQKLGNNTPTKFLCGELLVFSRKSTVVYVCVYLTKVLMYTYTYTYVFISIYSQILTLGENYVR